MSRAPAHVCGGCSTCCHTLPVPALRLGRFTPCPHECRPPAASPGCGIYEHRPLECVSWTCVWLTDSTWPDELRPDRCGVAFDCNPDLILVNGKEIPAAQAWVEPGREKAYEEPFVGGAVRALLDKGLAIVWRGRDQTVCIWRMDGQIVIAPSAGAAMLLGNETQRAQRAAQLLEGKGVIE